MKILALSRQTLIFAALIVLAPSIAAADSAAEVATRIERHRFTPSEIHVPAHTLVLLTVTNADSAPEEFDSPDLNVEKVVAGGSSGVIHLRPLKPGKYRFTGEFHSDTAFGLVIAQ